uniref:Transmembrane and coiled-coil domain family 3 n=1 Tax=Hippocampus comes TaxID=109280 RepID=A0A3Q2Z8E8_HIPCM
CKFVTKSENGNEQNRFAERSGWDVLSIPVPMRRGGSESNLDDVVDGVGLDFNKGALGIDSLQQKILKVTEQIKVEQTARDQNVAEYLKLVNNADKQQMVRIRQVFEKKNRKSAHSIGRLQRKLEQYHRRARDSEANGKHGHKDGARDSGGHGKEGGLREVGASGRHPALDKVKTVGPGVSLSPPFFFNKSRGLASLIRNRYGSADNIAHLKSMDAGSGLRGEVGGRGLSGSANTVAKSAKYHSDDECADAAGGRHRGAQRAVSAALTSQFRYLRKDPLELCFRAFWGVVRYERLEDQLNDLTELHQHETGNLKQELASIEEKVAYQAYERARDIQEVLESCQTRVSKLELQQQQQQQTVQLENADAKVLLGKCINIMLAFATVILVCVSTAAKFAAPLLRSRLRLALTCVGVSLLALLWKNWEHLQCALERLLLPH